MIEAVNSTIANAALVRNIAEQVSSARLQSSSLAQERREVSAPVAPYVSPYIKVDTEFDKAVLQIRDASTGDVIDQYPRETTMAARQREEILRDAQIKKAEQSARDAESQEARAENAASSRTGSSIQPSSYTNTTSNTAFIAQSSAIDVTTPSVSNASLAVAAFASGAQSGVSNSQGVSVTA